MNMLERFRKNEYVSFPFYGLTRSRVHKKYYKFFEETSTWKEQEILDWQLKKLKDIVQYAYQHVPFYRCFYSEHGINPFEINSFQDFEKIPCVDKTIVKNNAELFYSDEWKTIPCRVDYTGGSTGQPMKFLVDEEIYEREEAIYRFYWKKLGYEVGDKCIVLRGNKIYTDKNPKVYEYNRFWNYMYLDSFYLKAEYFDLYVEAISRFKADVIQAYPSSLMMLARLFDMKKIKAPAFKIIILGSENVDEQQIDYFKKVFSCERIYNQYGHSEKATLALQLLDGKALGVVPTYGYAEIVDDNDRVINSVDVAGEIVATGFSRSMPLIRYKTSDRAAWSTEEACGFMRDWKKFSCIEGRLQEFILTKTGRKVSICTVGGAHIAELENVIDMQYEQKMQGELIINVVVGERLSQEAHRRIEEKYELLFENEVICRVNEVEKLERTSRGKKIMLIQHCNLI